MSAAADIPSRPAQVHSDVMTWLSSQWKSKPVLRRFTSWTYSVLAPSLRWWKGRHQEHALYKAHDCLKTFTLTCLHSRHSNYTLLLQVLVELSSLNNQLKGLPLAPNLITVPTGLLKNTSLIFYDIILQPLKMPLAELVKTGLTITNTITTMWLQALIYKDHFTTYFLYFLYRYFLAKIFACVCVC